MNQEGFYTICSKTYDEKIRLLHTHRKNFKVAQDWCLETKAVSFFNLHVISEEQEQEKIRETSVTLLGLDSNRFVVSNFEVEETIQANEKAEKGGDFQEFSIF